MRAAPAGVRGGEDKKENLCKNWNRIMWNVSGTRAHGVTNYFYTQPATCILAAWWDIRMEDVSNILWFWSFGFNWKHAKVWSIQGCQYRLPGVMPHLRPSIGLDILLSRFFTAFFIQKNIFFLKKSLSLQFYKMVTHQFNNPPTNNVKAGDPVGSKTRCEQFYGTPCRLGCC